MQNSKLNYFRPTYEVGDLLRRKLFKPDIVYYLVENVEPEYNIVTIRELKSQIVYKDTPMNIFNLTTKVG